MPYDLQMILLLHFLLDDWYVSNMIGIYQLQVSTFILDMSSMKVRC